LAKRFQGLAEELNRDARNSRAADARGSKRCREHAQLIVFEGVKAALTHGR
jgi:hypothetical protein